MATKKKALQAAAGAAGAGEAVYIDSLFSTYLYTGTGSAQDITTGIDSVENDSLIWIKNRSSTSNNILMDTLRGTNYVLFSESTSAQNSGMSSFFTSFNSDGFSVAGTYGGVNASGNNYASWTFRKAPKFFDIVTYTGDGNTSQTINHNLGSVPGFIVVKRLETTGPWMVYHRSLSAAYFCYLSAADDAGANSAIWNNTEPTSTTFTVGNNSTVNASGGSYIAYLFAHNDGDGEFGESGDQDIIKCGSFTTDGSGNATVNLGWEPQWVLAKRSDNVQDWKLLDVMRGFSVGSSDDNILYPNTSGAEGVGSTWGSPTATGFTANGQPSSATFIYIAIRRPHKPAESGTEVFAVDLQGNTSPTPPTFYSGFPIDAMIYSDRDGTYVGETYSRLTGDSKKLLTHSTAAEASGGGSNYSFDRMDGSGTNTGLDTTRLMWMFKRSPGFFDVVAYAGDGVSGRTVSHNLGVAPEMMWVKSRNGGFSWYVYTQATGNGNTLYLNDTAGASGINIWNYTNPSETSFTLGSSAAVNGSSYTYIAYLFATLPGVSKVGSYTGNGTSQTIDCGFTSGARFVLIKNATTTSDWSVFDTERGIVAGNDPWLKLNSTNAEITLYDMIDPDSTGFHIPNGYTSLNSSGDTFIYLAIA